MRLFLSLDKVGALVLCLALAGCAEIGEPDIGSPPVSAAVAETVPVNGTLPQGSTGTTSPQLPPSRPEGFVPSLVVATAAGVVLIPDSEPPNLLTLSLVAPVEGSEVTEPPLSPGIPQLAIDDFFRGLVVQFDSGAVHWFQAEGGDAHRINVDGGRLLDVGFFNGTTEAIVAVGPQIDRVRLVDTERFPLLLLASNQELLDFSAGGSLYVAAIANDQCGQLLFVNAVGEEVPVLLPLLPPCETPKRPRYGSVALSGDGGAVAYTEVTYRSDGVEAETTLKVVDLAGRGVVLSKVVGDSGDRITNLSFDGQRVAMMKESSNADVELQVVSDSETLVPDLGDLGTPIAATWARLPVAAGSVE